MKPKIYYNISFDGTSFKVLVYSHGSGMKRITIIGKQNPDNSIDIPPNIMVFGSSMNNNWDNIMRQGGIALVDKEGYDHLFRLQKAKNFCVFR